METGDAQSIQISIHALRKESDVNACRNDDRHGISIHALRKESDSIEMHHDRCDVISIHALRKESDGRGR